MRGGDRLPDIPTLASCFSEAGYQTFATGKLHVHPQRARIGFDDVILDEEGRIVDGCITCPWHGYQYSPETGASPPPFIEKIPTFNARVVDGAVWVDPRPNPPGTRVEPATIEGGDRG